MKNKDKDENNKPFYKKLWFWVFIMVGLGFAVIGPMVINALYIKNEGYITVWRGEDVLSYYGSLLGAVATIIAVILTIKFTVEKEKKERKEAVKPYLQTRSRTIYSLSDKVFDEDVVYIKIENGIITPQRNIPYEIFKIKQDLKHVNENKNINFVEKLLNCTEKEAQFFKSFCVLEYEIENYGSSTTKETEIYMKGISLLPKFCIRQGEVKKIVLIISKDLTDSIIGFVFEFYDIYSLGKYCQKETFELRKLDNETFVLNCDMLTSPKEIREDENNGQT